MSRNLLARAILATVNLDEVEAHSREVCGCSEIDYERDKAARLQGQPSTELDQVAALSQLDEFEGRARSRGVTHTTFRRLAEALNLNGSHREDLRQLLISRRPELYEAPLWRIAADA